MPTYNFINKETGEETSVFMKISELDEFLKNSPHLSQIIGAPMIVDSTKLMGGIKTDDGFKDVLRRIKSHHHRSTIEVN